MGSRGGNAPNPYRQRQVSTLFLRVPFTDWSRVKIGEKTEFRTKPREGSRLLSVNTPTPVVAYAVNGRGEYDAKLMLLLERRYEPLFAICDDEEGLAREGFENYELFRRYWRKRQKGVYRPMQRVYVWRVMPWEPRLMLSMEGERLLAHLYEDFLP